MNRIKSSFKLNNSNIFFLLWTVYTVSYCLFNASELVYKYSILRRFFIFEQYGISLMLMFSIIFLNRYNIKSMVKYLTFGVLVFLMQLNSTDMSMLLLTLFVISAKGIDFKKIIKFDMKLKLLMVVIVVGLCLSGFIDNYSAEINGNFKQALGFSHPNTFGALCYTILAEYTITKLNDMKFIHIAGVGALWYFTLTISGSRTMGYTFALIYILLILYKYFPEPFYNLPIKIGFIIVAPLMMIASFLAVKMYDNGVFWAIQLDNILTTRLSSASMFLKLYDIKLFGQEVKTVSTRAANMHHTRSMILDNAYIRGMLMYGLVFMVFLCIAYMMLIGYLLKNKKVDYVLFCFYFICVGIGESYMINIVFNITILMLIECKFERISLTDLVNSIKNKRKYIYGKI